MTLATARTASPRIPGPNIPRLSALCARIGSNAAAAFAAAERSHHRRLGFAFMTPEMLNDIRLSAEDATGLPSQEPGLPFFMQTGFDKR